MILQRSRYFFSYETDVPSKLQQTPNPEAQVPAAVPPLVAHSADV